MSECASLAQLKKELPGALGIQVRNVSLLNMCAEDHFPSEESCIIFAQGFGLIPNNESRITHCKGSFCRVVNDKTCKVGFSFRCYNKKSHSKHRCLKDISALHNTLFEGSRLTIHDIFKVVMCFVSKLSVTQVVEQLGLSTVTVIDWYAICREVCEVILANEFQGKIGGEGMIVEVDESQVCTRKYGVGRKLLLEDKWLLVCYCRETTQFKILRIKDKKRATIMPLLLKIIDQRSIILTDFEKVYKGCEMYGFRVHESVRHKRYLVCPIDSNICTDNLDVTWRWHRNNARSCGGEDCIDRHLGEAEYRHRYFHDIDMRPLPLDDKFLLFCYHIRLVYPGASEVGLTFPVVDDDVDDGNTSEAREPVSAEGAGLLHEYVDNQDGDRLVDIVGACEEVHLTSLQDLISRNKRFKNC